jgi:hypothetical protein
MATQLNIVNDVLQRLREDTVSTVSSSAYSQLIAMFLNDAKEDLEDIWFWNVYDTTVTTAIAASTNTVDISETNDRSFLIRQADDNTPHAYDITTSENSQLYDMPLKALQESRATYRGTVPELPAPTKFALEYASDFRGFQYILEQNASGARSWQSHWYIPQAELAVDGTADSTVLQLPERPLFLRTLYYALNERGEEMGEPGGVAEMRAERAAAAAMEIDMQVQKKSNEKDMTNLEQLRNNIWSDSF